MEQMIQKVTQAVNSLPEKAEQKQPYIIAIDGRCAAGKTTLAAHLQELFQCPVIHMDHFFLRPEQRTEERLRTPGGNVDCERFLEEVMTPLKQGTSFRYRPFDCQTQALAAPIEISLENTTPNTDMKNIVIIEGSYSCHPMLWGNYDLRIFLTVDSKEQLKRIRRRNGEADAAAFSEKWIPLEELYFAAYQTEKRCELHLTVNS